MPQLTISQLKDLGIEIVDDTPAKATPEATPEPEPQPEAKPLHIQAVEASPFVLSTGRVVLTPPVLKGLAKFDGTNPLVVPTSGKGFRAAVLIFAHDGQVAVQNLATPKASK